MKLALSSLLFLIACGLTACGAERLPQGDVSRALAEHVVLVQVDGLSAELLDAYLRSPQSRTGGRALARWLGASPADGGTVAFRSGQLHTGLLPLPGLSDTTAATLLSGQPPLSTGVRDPSDWLKIGTPTIADALARSVIVGFPTAHQSPLGLESTDGLDRQDTLGLESNDEDRVSLALTGMKALPQVGPQLVVIRLSSLGDALLSRGIGAGPEGMARIDGSLSRLLTESFAFDPKDTMLILTSGFAAGPAPTGTSVRPGELMRDLRLKGDSVVPTGGLARFESIDPKMVKHLVDLPATAALLRREGALLSVWDPDLERLRAYREEDALGPDFAPRLLSWLGDGEWVAIADRAKGHEFRRVGEDAAKVSYGGVTELESRTPFVFAGAVGAGQTRSDLRCEEVFGLVLTVLGRDEGQRSRWASVLTRPRELGPSTLQPPVLLIDRSQAKLSDRLPTGLPRRVRAFTEGGAFDDGSAGLAASSVPAVIYGEPAKLLIATPLLAAWGGPERVSTAVSSLGDAALEVRVRSMLNLGAGLSALESGDFEHARTSLALATDIPPELEDWSAAFQFFAGLDRDPDLAAPTFKGADAAYLAALLPVMRGSSGGAYDGAPTPGQSEVRRVFLAAAATTLLVETPDDCAAHDEPRRAALKVSAEVFEARGERGLSAQAWARLSMLAGPRTGPSSEAQSHALDRLVESLEHRSAGWTRMATAEAVTRWAVGAGLGRGPDARRYEAIARLGLISLQHRIAADREAGFGDRNAARIADSLRGLAHRMPSLAADTVTLAVKGDPRAEDAVFRAVLASSLDLFALTSNRPGTGLTVPRRLLSAAAAASAQTASSGTDRPAVAVRQAIIELFDFVDAALIAEPVPPTGADELLSAHDLDAERLRVLAETAADAPIPVVAYGPFVHAIVRAASVYSAMASGEPDVALKSATALIEGLSRTAKSEAGRVGADALLVADIEASTQSALALTQRLLGPEKPAAALELFEAERFSKRLKTDSASLRPLLIGLTISAVLQADLLSLSQGFSRATLDKSRIQASKRALEAALMAFTSAGGGYDGLSAQLIVALILSAQAAIEDTAAWAKGPLDPVAVVVLSPALRRTLSESAVRLRSQLDPATVAAGLQAGDLAVAMGDMVLAVFEGGPSLFDLAVSGQGDRARHELAAHFKRGLRLTGGPTAATLRDLYTLGLTLTSRSLGDGAAGLAAVSRVEKATTLPAWLPPFIRLAVESEPQARGRAAEAMANICPKHAWQAGLDGVLQVSVSGNAAALEKATEAFVIGARRASAGATHLELALTTQRGHDGLGARLKFSLPGLVTGGGGGSFELEVLSTSRFANTSSATAQLSTDGEQSAPAQQAFLAAAMGALLRDDAEALDAALGHLMQTLAGSDPAVLVSLLMPADLPMYAEILPSLTEPLATGWIAALAEARGHHELSAWLFERLVKAVDEQGVDLLTPSAGGFIHLCAADTLACRAPALLTAPAQASGLKSPALSALSAYVSKRLELRMAKSGRTAALTPALAEASIAAPLILPPYVRSLFEVAVLGTAPKFGLPSRAAIYVQGGRQGAAPTGGAQAALDDARAGGLRCDAALVALRFGLTEADPERIGQTCGRGLVYVEALLRAPAAGAQRAGNAAAAILSARDASIGAGLKSVEDLLDRAIALLLSPGVEARAAALTRAPGLIVALARSGRTADVVRLIAFQVAADLERGEPLAGANARVVNDTVEKARVAGLRGKPSVRFLKQLREKSGGDPRTLAREYLKSP